MSFASTKIHTLGCLSFIAYIALSFLSRQDGVLSLHLFYLCLGTSWAALLFLFLKKETTLHLSSILIWAALFRVAGIFAIPIYEDDYFRFLWDGYVFSEHGSPYGVIPMDHFGNPDVPDHMQDVLSGINHPNLPTIYGPVTEYIFNLSYQLAPGNLITLKAFFLIFECLFLFCMHKIVNLRKFFFLAWCPLLIVETTFQAHPDIIAISIMSLAYLLLSRQHFVAAMGILAVAVSSKVFAVLAGPFFLRKKHWLLQLTTAFFITLSLYSLFLFSKGDDAGFTSLGTMASDWEFNAAFFTLFRQWLGSGLARLVCLAIFALAYLLILFRFWKKQSRELSLVTVYGLFFILSPVINPWYLLWLLPFMMQKMKWWSLSAIIVVSLSYITGMNLGNEQWQDFENPAIVSIIEFGILFGALFLDLTKPYRLRLT